MKKWQDKTGISTFLCSSLYLARFVGKSTPQMQMQTETGLELLQLRQQTSKLHLHMLQVTSIQLCFLCTGRGGKE